MVEKTQEEKEKKTIESNPLLCGRQPEAIVPLSERIEKCDGCDVMLIQPKATPKRDPFVVAEGRRYRNGLSLVERTDV
jgi:hypothetical protein